jgi:hypothetical protein
MHAFLPSSRGFYSSVSATETTHLFRTTTLDLFHAGASLSAFRLGRLRELSLYGDNLRVASQSRLGLHAAT